LIEAFFFGEKGREVFGTYHAPDGGVGDSLTVICPALFSEYMRTHQAVRELAISLAAAGSHVIRFDYRGTGDSSGHISDVRLSDWTEDIAAVISEGIDISFASSVKVVGIRAGGLLLCNALPMLANVEKAVIWDAPSDGATYINVLHEMQQNMLTRNPYLRSSDKRRAAGHFGGQPLSAEMVEGLRSVGANVYTDIDPDRLDVIYTTDECAPPATIENRRLVRFPCNWGTDTEDMLIPQPVLERLRASVLGS
jgi:pimeloyl-ACP methyl ester carboxylesterase